MNDNWEEYEVNFMVYEPKLPAGETMCFAGEREEMGKWEPQPMTVVSDDQKWMKKRKYGLPVKRYFQHVLKLKQTHWNGAQINYNFSRHGGQNDYWEQIPARRLII